MTGSVTNAAGSISGVSFADLIECFAHQSGDPGGWQDLVMMSNFANPDARYMANQVYKGEKYHSATMVAMRSDSNFSLPTPPPPLGVRFYYNVQQTFADPADPNLIYTYKLQVMSATYSVSSCSKKQLQDTSMWVEYTRYDDVAGPVPADGFYKVEGTYGGQTSGTFSAPRIFGTPANGSKPTCLTPP